MHAGEQVVYHVHTHLTVYLTESAADPARIGIVQPVAAQSSSRLRFPRPTATTAHSTQRSSTSHPAHAPHPGGEHHRAPPRSASVRTRDIQIDVGSPAVAPRTVDWKKTRL